MKTADLFIVHCVLLSPAFWRALEAFVVMQGKGRAENDRCTVLALGSERDSADIPLAFPSCALSRLHNFQSI